MRAFLIVVMLMGCGTDEPTACEIDVAAFYESGCTFALADGTHVDEAELLERCAEHVEKAGAHCTAQDRRQEFTSCLGGASVVCE